MERQSMIDLLKGLPGPITDAIVVYDDGCEFCILQLPPYDPILGLDLIVSKRSGE
jgi:hypothetical protein